MNPFDLIPMRWPSTWGEPRFKDLPHSPVNCLLLDQPQPELVESYAKIGIAVLPLKSPPAALYTGKWPRVRISTGRGNADAGPTGLPWIDSNGYAVQATRAVQPGRPVWIECSDSNASPDSVRLAISEAAAYGARWLIQPDLATWDLLTGTLDFFERHKHWRDYRPLGPLAVIADFSGSGRALALETLNLLTRRQLPFVVLTEANAARTDWTEFHALLYLGEGQPPKTGVPVLRPTSQDPYQIAMDAHLQMSRRYDALRLWNAGAINACYTASPDGRAHLVQLLNYAARDSSAAVTLGLTRRYSSARLTTLDQPQPRPIALQPVPAGVELRLPPFPVYAAIELE